jgi:hypothetical protein
VVSGATNGEPAVLQLRQNTVVCRLPDVIVGQPTPVNVAFDGDNTVLLLSCPNGAGFAPFPVAINLS